VFNSLLLGIALVQRIILAMTRSIYSFGADMVPKTSHGIINLCFLFALPV